ncbi:hypothetical protein L1987_03049 [Smallanthus sonchifolius]|uniref:Uncharacterized protein n=1 Tax=Smallanthus sonchifolius TaxID=185202 RepID=A0ACB9K9J0_9ASTR|nr:hypothetical protein L1987_03049 [Smallanthus sonchifolius]
MNCFNIFNSKTKRRSKSSPEAGEPNPATKPSTRSVKSAGSTPSPRSILDLYKEKGHNLRKFSFTELRSGTDNFNRLLKIGEGGFGSVYKGSIRPPGGHGEPLVVAIKKLRRNGMQGHKEWLTEVQFLVPPIPWVTRLKIILSAAEGLAYLHEGLEIQVIFRDFKSSNVLLDENFNAKLSDFGLAREGPQGDRSHVSTRPIGTYGYAAPEYVETGHLKSNSDLWSFGVVLYEILSGRKAVDIKLPQSEQKLIEWVKQFPADSNRFQMIMDPRLNNQYSHGAAQKVAKLADSCLRKNPEERPLMSRIVEILQEAIRESNISEIMSPLPEPCTLRMVRVACKT